VGAVIPAEFLIQDAKKSINIRTSLALAYLLSGLPLDSPAFMKFDAHRIKLCSAGGVQSLSLANVKCTVTVISTAMGVPFSNVG